MGEVKERNIKNRTCYFFDDMIDIWNFQPDLLKTDKKPYKNIDIYYIGYITIKKIGDYENIRSVNPLYLIINSVTGYFKEKNGEKYLIISMPQNYEGVFSEILSEIIIINGKKKNRFMKKIMLELELIQTMIYP